MVQQLPVPRVPSRSPSTIKLSCIPNITCPLMQVMDYKVFNAAVLAGFGSYMTLAFEFLLSSTLANRFELVSRLIGPTL